jgi:NADPH-ferrihemoprotein reductase
LPAGLDDFDHTSLAELKETQLCAFVVSTYGDGDLPDSAEGLWAFLKSAEGDETLASLRYVIFGLGNSNYRQYNYIAKTIDARLRELGATRLGNLGAGDDGNGNTETDFLRWGKETQTALQNILGLTEQVQRYQPLFDVKKDASIADDQLHYGVPVMASQATPTCALIKEARKLWETEDRLCIHMELDLGANRQLKYKTGDHLAVWPCNPDHEVDVLLECLGLSGRRHNPITVHEIAVTTLGKLPCLTPTTLDALFRNYIEVCGRLSVDLISGLAEFSPSSAVRTNLLEVAEDPDTFKEMVNGPQLTLTGLLSQVSPGTQWDIPLSFLLERLKPMQPRYYSISSSAVVNPRIATITAVVNKPAPERGDNQSIPLSCHGLATGYLWAQERRLNNNASNYENLSSYALNGPRRILSGEQIFCTTRQTSFKMPTKLSAPIIMIGAGTGVAPFRAFVWERVQRSENEEVGRTLLFMGFRNSGVDFIYKDDRDRWQQSLKPEVFDYWTACSRDDQQGKKVYVQNLIDQHQDEVMDLLEVTGCRIFLCGSATMARDVVDTLVRVRCCWEGCSRDDALAWVKKLRQFGTLLEDVWG